MEVDVLLARVHVRLARLVIAVFTRSTREALEALSLFSAVTLFWLLILLHLYFISQPTCLVSELSKPELGLSELKGSELPLNTTALPWHVLRVKVSGIWDRRSAWSLISEPNSKNKDEELSTTPLFDNLAMMFPALHDIAKEGEVEQLTGNPRRDSVFIRDLFEEIYSAFVGDLSYQFSFERGYLFLRDELKAKHGIVVANVTLYANDTCLGTPWFASVVENLVGYDTIIVNSLIKIFRGRGYFYNLQTSEIYNLFMVTEITEMAKYLDDYITLKIGMIVTSALLYLVAVTVVSFALRETQVRVLNFSLMLHRLSRIRLSVGKLILFHVLQCIVFVVIMIGILYCIAEILDDTFLALLVLSHIWMGELYTMICSRTPTSQRYFPKFFYLYFLLFSLYFFSYPFGFYYLAFFCMASFVQHAMLYFYNRFELPALEAGTIRIDPLGTSLFFQSLVTPLRAQQANIGNNNNNTNNSPAEPNNNANGGILRRRVANVEGNVQM
eukprot:TRINITY_DN6584_c0_g1_i1.p1 TRINITY_DN6584_c0_g1~~TRINITY_DN6584_c0_g1_i1.p1  ORF type:complete len:499 (+),score=49.08 TRINITY_DN6584_c0_g1_i1:152-1648(+)